MIKHGKQQRMGDAEGLLFPLLCLYMYGNYPMPPLVQTHPPSLSDQCDLTKPTALLQRTMITLAGHLCPAEQLDLYPWDPARGLLIEGHAIRNNFTHLCSSDVCEI